MAREAIDGYIEGHRRSGRVAMLRSACGMGGSNGHRSACDTLGV
jgi:hypothetical protein